MHHRPRKRFGQNFLQDQSIIRQILHVFNPKPQDTILEIGPGLGALTKPLLALLPQLTAIELDRDLFVHLTQLASPTHRLNLVNADALTVDFNQWPGPLRIIGNLPYNISTPLIFHLLNHASQISDMLFMLQKEVVERLAAAPGSKDYGRLSIMVQYCCAVDYVFDVPPTAFYPPPKVDSAIVALKPYQVSPYPAVNRTHLSNLVTTAFSMRRKTLANNLKSILNVEAIAALGINPSLRPEQISILQYVQLAQSLNK